MNGHLEIFVLMFIITMKNHLEKEWSFGNCKISFTTFGCETGGFRNVYVKNNSAFKKACENENHNIILLKKLVLK